MAQLLKIKLSEESESFRINSQYYVKVGRRTGWVQYMGKSKIDGMHIIKCDFNAVQMRSTPTVVIYDDDSKQISISDASDMMMSDAASEGAFTVQSLFEDFDMQDYMGMVVSNAKANLYKIVFAFLFVWAFLYAIGDGLVGNFFLTLFLTALVVLLWPLATVMYNTQNRKQNGRKD